MKLLLDENLPIKFREDFPNHEVYTVNYKKWNGIKNGELLKLMLSENFDALITFDKNLQYQQNFSKYTITVFVLSGLVNTYQALTVFSPKINEELLKNDLPKGVIIIT